MFRRIAQGVLQIRGACFAVAIVLVLQGYLGVLKLGVRCTRGPFSFLPGSTT